MKLRLFVLATLVVALFASVAGLTTPTPAQAQAAAPKGFVRIIHVAPGAPEVDLYLDGAAKPAVSKLAYGKSTAILSLDAKTYRVAVRKAGDPATAAPVYQSSFSVAADKVTDVVAIGVVGKTDETGFRIAQFQVDVTATKQARLYVLHASPDAPAVDVLGGGAAIKALRFGVESRSRDLDPGNYTLYVTSGAKATSALLKVGPLTLKAGHVYVAVVTGLVKELTPFVFDALAATAEKIDSASYTGRIQIVHGAVGVGAVDIYLNGASKPAVAKLAAGAGTDDWITLNAGDYTVQIRPAGTPIYNLPAFEGKLKVAPNSAQIVVALGKLGGEPAFDLKAFAVDLSKPAAGKARLYAIHAGASTPSVDIRANGKVIIPDFKFGTYTEKGLEVDPGAYTITGVASGTRSPVLVSLALNDDAYGSVKAGNVYIVIAYGDLNKTTPIVITQENK